MYTLYFPGLAVALVAAAGSTLSIDARGAGDGASAALTFEEAWRRTREANPGLQAARAFAQAAGAAVRQTGARPAPVVSVEAENAAGSGEFDGWESAETTLAVSRTLETGGKRKARVRSAAAGQAGAEARVEAGVLEAWSGLAEAFIEALADRQRVALAEEHLRVADGIRKAVAERVAAGRVPPLDATKAEAEVAMAEVDLANARQSESASRRRLAALWGAPDDVPVRLAGHLDRVPSVPPEETLRTALSRHPALVESDRMVEAARARIDEVRASASPDIDLSAGIRRHEESGDHAFVAGLSIPIPASGRARAAIDEALRLAEAAEAERRAVGIRLRAETDGRRSEADMRRAEADALRDKVLPALLSAFDTARAGYEQGKHGYLELLDAERALIDGRRRLLDTRAAYARALAGLARAIGKPELFSISENARENP